MLRNVGSLKPNQWLAVEALLAGQSIADAAQAAGVADRTLLRWRRTDPAFRAAIDAGTADALREFSRSLLGLVRDAVSAFEDALAADQPIHVRLRAADALTGRLLQIRDQVDLSERLAALEDLIGGE